jgi:hypothetical protein
LRRVVLLLLQPLARPAEGSGRRAAALRLALSG